MALKSVVVDPFFDALAATLVNFESTQGSDFNLVLLSSSPHHRGQWDLTVAARWMDDASIVQTIATLNAYLRSKLANSNEKLGRVKVRTTSDALVRSITEALDVPEFGTAYRVTGLELDLFGIDEAVCLLSRPLVTRKPEEVST